MTDPASKANSSTGPASGPADSVGVILARRRKERGLTTAAVSEKIRIRRIYLEALEEDRYDDLPGKAYIAGFIRGYAGVLDLDGDALVQLYRTRNEAPTQAAPQAEPSAEPPIAPVAAPAKPKPAPRPAPREEKIVFPEPVIPSRAPQGMLVGVAIAAAFVITAGFFAYERMKAPSAHDLVLPPPAQTNAQAQPEAPTASDQSSAPEGAEATASTPVPDEQPRTLPAPVGNARVMLVGQEESWILVSSPSRGVISDRTLKAGEVYEVPDLPDLRLTVGNASGVTVVLDGKPLASLGARGLVRRDIRLSPAELQKLQP